MKIFIKSLIKYFSKNIHVILVRKSSPGSFEVKKCRTFYTSEFSFSLFQTAYLQIFIS